MFRYILRRILYMAVTLFIIATVSFFLMKMLPGSPLKAEDKLSEEQREIVLEKYGLNDPVPVQYVRYIGGLVKGDLGISFTFDNTPVTKILMDRIGPSAQLGAQALLIGTFLGILLGLIAAISHNGALDYTSTILAVLGTSIPSFVFAGLLQRYLAVEWELFPVALWGTFEHTILPTVALMIFPMATAARFTRTEMIEVMGSNFITTARAKGVSEYGIIFKHGLRNALIPLVTVMGPMAVSLMTGTLVIEKIFAVPGIGEQFVTSVMVNDYPTIMGTTLLFAFLFVLIILVIDLLYVLIDPRIRLTGGES
ncbi:MULTISPECIES: oligopeptide ABC transporter permease [Virgibacillus]|jgi:oligopeptide transport system permease protein|uniref:ABC transporter permease n=1 Tax=Virgibacillus halodenitrificans TaxID=1482 RepID=A0AAC9J3C6_VIRHA|nr:MULTISPECIES: oligopeptide ABC transporter permease [Virgibacillus]AIF44762.1 peptide ABC transporter permease [Virgibacillus sp. SK37]APC49848.1 peptide ABC transporter permease [Virgibacillus halodenitrificans]MBD1223481.1 ABC transporter permease [Virgibacillus halodenitrificans]MCG1029162.1 ABC transporter permease [Virgibacillus halodenitrificans]MCJ0932771.1 ABC transporter permease [Virgibacillus halodenitrificans]